MYAVIKNGGKQYRVSEGEVIELEKIAAAAGESVDINEVLMVVDGDRLTVGTPFVSGAKVRAEVLLHDRADKVIILKFKRRKHHLKRQGHRQHFTKVKITGIESA